MTIVSVMKKPFFGRYQRRWVWPEGIDRDDWRRVEFKNRSGATLVGLYGKAKGSSPKAIVVLPHPMHADAKGYVLKAGHARLLRDGGYDVFAFDFNGFGESEDGRFEFPEDIWHAGHAAAAEAPGLGVALLGISMGGGYGICALDMPDHPFRVAIIEGAFTSLEEYWRPYLLPYALLRLTGWILPAELRRLRPIDRIRGIRGLAGMLFIHGARDRISPPSMGERFHQACPLPPERRVLWVVPDAKHLRTLEIAPDEYRRRVLGFLDAHFPQAKSA